MHIYYTRISSGSQNLDRQKVIQPNYSRCITDVCSGAIPFFQRTGGYQIKVLADKGVLKELSIMSIDRCGRDLKDLLHTISFFTNKGICVHFIHQGLRTINPDGTENIITKTMIGILGTLSEQERLVLKERQKEGIQLAKLRGVYCGRKKGSKEDVLKFLSKPKNQAALNYLKKNYNNKECALLAGIHINTLFKIKRLAIRASTDK